MTDHEDSETKDDPNATYIHSWLRHTSFSAMSPSQPDNLSPLPISPPNLPDHFDNAVADRQLDDDISSSLRALPLDDLLDGANVELFGRNSLDLHFDIERTQAVGVLDAVLDIHPHLPPSASHDETAVDTEQEEFYELEYDPEYDGTIEDEHILQRNLRNPWPYDRQPLMRPSYRDSLTRAPPKLSSLVPQKRKREPLFTRPAIRHTASKLAIRASSFLSTKTVGDTHGLPNRIPNSAVPHPNWGTYAFRSDSDSLYSDDSDGDVRTWLQRVVRRNIRTGIEAFHIVTDGCIPLTISEYELNGSWLYEQSYEEEEEEEEEHQSEVSTRSYTMSPVSSPYADYDSMLVDESYTGRHEHVDNHHGDERPSEDDMDVILDPADCPEIGSSGSFFSSHRLGTVPRIMVENTPYEVTSYVTAQGPPSASSSRGRSAGRSIRKAIGNTLRPLLYHSHSSSTERAAGPSSDAGSKRSISGLASRLSFLAPAPRLPSSASTSTSMRRRQYSPDPFEAAFMEHLSLSPPDRLADYAGEAAGDFEFYDDECDERNGDSPPFFERDGDASFRTAVAYSRPVQGAAGTGE